MKIDSNFRFLAAQGQGLTFTGEASQICYASLEDCQIEAPARFCSGVKIDAGSIGAFSFFNQNCSLRYVQSIGRFCLFAPEVLAGGAVHPVTSVSTHLLFQNMDNSWNQDFHTFPEDSGYLKNLVRYQKEHEFLKKTRISIGNDVWVGSRAILMRGIHIGDGAVIGAGAVVTRDVEPYTIVGGVPARPIRKRFSDKVIEKLEEIRWWDYGPDILKGLDLNHPEEAVKYLEERAARGFPLYTPDKFLFHQRKEPLKGQKEKFFYINFRTGGMENASSRNHSRKIRIVPASGQTPAEY